MVPGKTGVMSAHDSHPRDAVATEREAVTEQSPGSTLTRHGSRWAQPRMWLPVFLVIGALIVAGSIAGFSGLLWVLGCMAMLATMWLFMKAFDH